jgi:uncharacterized iron-regulated membrane protein
MSANPGAATYRAIWRWHFYAGLFCVPFVIWAAVTGSIYLFKPQIEAWLDRPYDNLTLTAPPAAAADHIRAAMAAVPGATFVAYELPETPQSAVRVILGQGAGRYRVYVHPATTEVLDVLDEDTRPMRRVFYLHGELMMGRFGSTFVELAASWAIMMLLTGLFLWWPRQGNWLLGVFVPRLWKGGRMFWRDLHAVTGVWVTMCALFLIATGLPWAKNWGGYLRWVREATGATAADRRWHTSHSEEMAERLAISNAMAAAAFAPAGGPAASLDAIDRMVAAVTPLGLAHPVLITPPMTSGGPWGAVSDAANRTLRTRIQLDPESGRVLFRDDFRQWHWIDRAVGFGIAVHEGQYFGLANSFWRCLPPPAWCC